MKAGKFFAVDANAMEAPGPDTPPEGQDAKS